MFQIVAVVTFGGLVAQGQERGAGLCALRSFVFPNTPSGPTVAITECKEELNSSIEMNKTITQTGPCGAAKERVEKPASFHPSRILCPVDFSDLSNLALKYAAAGARAFGCTLVVFHAQRFELPVYFTRSQIAGLTRQHRAEQEKAKELLRRHVRRILGSQASQLPLKFDLADAHPVDAVLSAAKRHRADLIVMGSHGRGGAKRLWLGSVAENVIRQADVPVFVARQKQHEFIDTTDARTTAQLATILCPVNFTDAARAGLEHATSLAHQFNARLVTACIVEPDEARGVAEVRQQLASWLSGGGHRQCEVQALARRGQAAEQIVSLAGKVKADLVVLGAQPRSLLQTWLWGDTTEFVLRHAPAPVLVVPQR
jgi:nucleotide-binding universal stress UspA family protein